MPYDEKVTYVAKATKQDTFPLSNPFPVDVGETIKFVSSHKKYHESGNKQLRLYRDTRFYLNEYTRSDGAAVPMITVLGDDNARLQNWILRPSTDRKVDSKVLVVQNIEDQEPVYIRLEKAVNSEPQYDVTIMQRVNIDSSR